MKTIFDILRGVVIGLANIIPGVSGGTMMVSMGIYDTIIGCINSLFKDFKRCVKMLWPYALGMVLGILGLAKLITFLLGSYPLPTNMAFIGLILGGLPMILKKMKELGYNGGRVIIAHNQNEAAALQLKMPIEELFGTFNGVIHPERALCCYYAEPGSVMVGFEA